MIYEPIFAINRDPFLRVEDRTAYDFGEKAMSRVCQVTGKRPMVGHHVSHANNKTKRRFNPNLQEHRFWLDSEKRYIKLRVSRKGMRIIDKLGLEQVLKDIKQREQEERN